MWVCSQRSITKKRRSTLKWITSLYPWGALSKALSIQTEWEEKGNADKTRTVSVPHDPSRCKQAAFTSDGTAKSHSNHHTFFIIMTYFLKQWAHPMFFVSYLVTAKRKVTNPLYNKNKETNMKCSKIKLIWNAV